MVRRPENVARKTVPSPDDSGGVPRPRFGDKNAARKTMRPGEGSSSRRKNPKPIKKSNTANEREAMKRVRLYGKSDFMIPRAPFFKLIKDALDKYIPNGGRDRLKIQRAALDALQLSAEAYLVQLFEDMNLLTTHAKRKTLMFQDFQTLVRLRANSFDTVMMDYKNRT